MFIGYYAHERYQRYLLPVYVFLGDNGFAAYVSAVKNEYVGKVTRTAPTTPQPTPMPTSQPTVSTPSPTHAPITESPTESPSPATPQQ